MASFDPGYGETEVSEEERAALTPSALRVLGEPMLKAALYDIEQTLQDRVGSALIDEIRSGALALGEVLSDHFVRDLHRRLYGDVWEWGGKFRLLQTNIGIAPEQIAVQLRSEMDNLRYRWEEIHDLDPKRLVCLPILPWCASTRLWTAMGAQPGCSPMWFWLPQPLATPCVSIGTSTAGPTLTRSSTTTTAATSPRWLNSSESSRCSRGFPGNCRRTAARGQGVTLVPGRSGTSGWVVTERSRHVCH